MTEGCCTHSYLNRRCHRVSEGLLYENTVNLFTWKTTLFWFMCLSHHWIWNARGLSNSQLLHHGRISFCEISECKNSHTQHVQPVWLTLDLLCFTEDGCGALAAGCIWLSSGLHWTFWERTNMTLKRSFLQPPRLCVKGDKILPHYQWPHYQD